MLVEKSRRGGRTDSTNPGIAILSIADEREEIGNQRRLYSELRTHALGVPDLHSLPDDLHHPVSAHALREILVVRPDAHLLDTRILCGEVRSRCESVVGLELDHRPDRDAHG